MFSIIQGWNLAFSPWRQLNKKIQSHLLLKPPCFILLSEPWNTVSVFLSTGRVSRHLLPWILKSHTHTQTNRRLHHRHIENTKNTNAHNTHTQFRVSVASSPLVPQTDRVIKSSLQSMQWQDSCMLADAAFAACFVLLWPQVSLLDMWNDSQRGRRQCVCVCVWLKMRGSTSAVKQIWHSDNQVLNCYSGFQNLKWGTCVYYMCLWVAVFFPLIQNVVDPLTSNCDTAFKICTQLFPVLRKAADRKFDFPQSAKWKTDSGSTLLHLKCRQNSTSPWHSL